MKNPFSGLFRARDKPRDAVSSAPSFYFGSSASGKSVTPSSAVQVSAVYACVRVIAETIASLPLHVYEATDTGSRSATPRRRASSSTSRTRQSSLGSSWAMISIPRSRASSKARTICWTAS